MRRSPRRRSCLHSSDGHASARTTRAGRTLLWRRRRVRGGVAPPRRRCPARALLVVRAGLVAFGVTVAVIPRIAQFTLRGGFFGKDLCKKHTPEAEQHVCAAVAAAVAAALPDASGPVQPRGARAGVCSCVHSNNDPHSTELCRHARKGARGVYIVPSSSCGLCGDEMSRAAGAVQRGGPLSVLHDSSWVR